MSITTRVSIRDIKAAAKLLVKAGGIIHNEALEKIARDNGFDSYHQALQSSEAFRASGPIVAPKRLYPYYISQRSDPKEGIHPNGQETVRILLDKSPEQLFPDAKVRRLADFGRSAPDNLIRYQWCVYGQSFMEFATRFQFFAATGLVPDKSSRGFETSLPFERAPGKDHTRYYRRVGTDFRVTIHQPYAKRGSGGEIVDARLKAFVEENHILCGIPKWRGLYEHQELTIFADWKFETEFKELMETLNALPWIYHSEGYAKFSSSNKNWFKPDDWPSDL